MSNIVAIVGRPNVGKSTLFNRLCGSRTAIVDSVAGVTRDRHYGISEWNGIGFSVIDTGGYVTGSTDIFEDEIRKQAQFAIDESDVILFVLDVIEGITPLDTEVSNLLRRSEKKVIIVVNKVDSNNRLANTAEFYALGYDELYPVSAINGSGTGELLDKLVEGFTEDEQQDLSEIPKIAVVGRPNVGKSSLINLLIGNERNIVTPVAGTTRDSIYTRFSKFGFDIYLVDTAGIRKKNRVYDNIEYYSTLRSIRAIENSDVCLLLLDASQGIESQDVNIFKMIEKNHKGVVIIVNKWDLIDKATNTHKEIEKTIKNKIAPFNDIPVIFTSILTKQRVFKALEVAHVVYNNRTRKISTSVLNETLLPVIEHYPPPTVKGRHIKIKYITQLPVYYPVFAFFCNSPQYVKEPYKRFLENKIREKFDYHGVPIEIYFREK